jgi:hypothetical protein
MPDNLDAWMKEGRYLPEFMRDFHDQKDLFKAMDEVAQRSVTNGNAYIKDVSWIGAQVYTVDIFLWVMAKHGYTLQKTRKPFSFGDIREFMNAAMVRWREQASAVLLAPFANRN